MANTEGLSDEALTSLLAMPSPEEERQLHSRRPQNAAATAGPRFPPRSLARREQMMELGEGETPSATVIRSSKPPAVRTVSSTKKCAGDVDAGERHVSFETSVEAPHEAETVTPEDDQGIKEASSESNQRPAIMSDCIRERPITNQRDNGSAGILSSANGSRIKESRFKQRNRSKNGTSALGPTAGGFPSLDIAPVGALTRKGRLTRVQSSQPPVLDREENAPAPQYPASMNKSLPTSRQKLETKSQMDIRGVRSKTDDVGQASEGMLANMSLGEIQDGVDEIQSILSADSIAFLKKRGRQKMTQSKGTGPQNGAKQSDVKCNNLSKPIHIENTGVVLDKEEEIKLEKQREREEKERTAKILSSIKTPEDMDRAYNEALKSGLATLLPSSTLGNGDTAATDDGKLREEGSYAQHKNLHLATSLLRSTAPRQRLLGARTICSILEEDANKLIESRRAKAFSYSENDTAFLRQSYPPLLPVALRCLLDESITASQTGGRVLLTLILRCIHSLMILFVHPYHVVHIGHATNGSVDPFVLYQTKFMSDVSHVPPGTELYPPTKIEPVEDGGATNGACYRADSSAATAESDSKAFYTDPAWTLLSRMRILPCLSDVILYLSKDFSSGEDIAATSISSVCGILAMLAVRSPGAAGAIAYHKGILPFLISYCLSPSNQGLSNHRALQDNGNFSESEISNDNGNDVGGGSALFNKNATSALILLCTLARQSRDVAQLEEPFEAVFPDLQAILCMQLNEEGLEMQKWSLILLRVLIRYGLAIQHIQSIISLAVPHVALSNSENSLYEEYLMLFANICDCAKAFSSQQRSEHANSEVCDSLAMAGVWLTSSVKSCSTSLFSFGKDELALFPEMKLAAAQINLLASYTSTASPTSVFGDGTLQSEMNTSFVPIVSRESCITVFASVAESKILSCALDIALKHSFSACWDTSTELANTCSLEEEAIACNFITSFMNFATLIEKEGSESTLRDNLMNTVSASLLKVRRNLAPSSSAGECPHVARQSWFVEAEFATLKFICQERNTQQRDGTFLMAFAFSIAGRLQIGHEAMAFYIFNQEHLFKVSPDQKELDLAVLPQSWCLQRTLLGELCGLKGRKAQLVHSSSLYFIHNVLSSGNAGPFILKSLRCTADFMGRANGRDDERCLLPMGGIWLWNVISSTVTAPTDESSLTNVPEEGEGAKAADIVAHALCLLLHLEVAQNGTSFPSDVNNGTKLYHIANVCLFPEELLREDFIEPAIALLFKQFTGSDQNTLDSNSNLVQDFIKACFNHSRISRERKSSVLESTKEDPTEKKFQDAMSFDQPSTEYVSKDEMRALNDFVSDMCDSYIEYGGQYNTFSLFMRFFLRHDFPPKIISSVLTNLHPILNLLTIDEKTESLFSSLVQSVSGGLPSLDSSRRDPSAVLDSFSASLKKRDKELLRNDYIYLLAVAVLSRNLASSSQRCDCGVQAMKNRLSGVGSGVFYDIFQASKQFISSGTGTREVLISSVLDICLDGAKPLSQQDSVLQNEWEWSYSSENATWDRAMKYLRDTSA